MSDKPTFSKGKAKEQDEDNLVEFPEVRTPGARFITPISKNELISIKALTAYVSHNQKVSEDVVRVIVQTQFHVEDLAKIQREDYERVIKFLVDIKVQMLMN